ncbi:hypothetical protein NDI37_17520 [Funiculus sociatus GB2-A5]|uniref:Uncharacterized protein n=1 Tax=Funiculus sociatus GB2-A5 TaxID=2933946 RepID=A0ABV0JS22_9CYAN|nr:MULTISPECIES: hypothetical protein [unclassified Trichocoleus]
MQNHYQHKEEIPQKKYHNWQWQCFLSNTPRRHISQSSAKLLHPLYTSRRFPQTIEPLLRNACFPYTCADDPT